MSDNNKVKVNDALKAYFALIGRKGGKWSDHRRISIGRLGGLASGASRRAKAKHNKKV